ncbi:hypothetical protein ACFLZC_01395 [Patescibacteria group bacterium]
MKNNTLKFLLISALLFLGFLQNANAIGETFFVNIMSLDKSPGTTVTYKITSFSFDVTKSDITWVLDGKIIESGVGKKTAEVILPEMGKEKTLSIYINTTNDVELSKSIILSGSDVDILLEPQTYTPYWYKGSPLTTIESNLKVVAIPHLFLDGKKIPSSSLFYQWSLNNKKDLDGSGYGKNSNTFTIKNYGDYVLNLKVYNKDESVTVEKAIIISANEAEPTVLFYEDHPLFGIMSHIGTQNGLQMFSDILKVVAEPFFFSKENLNNLSYEWEMNSNTILPTENPRVIEFKKPEQGSGVADVNLQIQNMSNIFQSASNKFKIIF